MSSFYEGQDPDVDPDGAAQSAYMAEQWAIKLDGPVDPDSDLYSSQYNAQLAATSATNASNSAGSAQSSADAAQAAADQLNSLLLGDLVDVTNTPPDDGNVLAWNATAGLWEPATPVTGQANVDALLAEMQALRAKLVAAGVIT